MIWQGFMLLVAICLETAAISLLKLSDGMTKLWPSVGMLIGYILSLLLLSTVLKSLPVGAVYAVWSGVGTSITAVVGYWAFGDRLPVGAWIGLVLIVVGVVLLSSHMPHRD
jgi:small multidrug resistance pump